MTIQTLQVDLTSDDRPILVSYRKLGDHAYLINDTILVLFVESAIGMECTFHSIKNYETVDQKIKTAIIELHQKEQE